MLFGPRLKTVFASRWNALFWSLGVLLTAYCTVPAADHVAKDQASTRATEAAVSDAQADADQRRGDYDRLQRLEAAER